MEVSVFVNVFPTYSETFIYNQIKGFILRGAAVTLYCQYLNDFDQNDHESIEFVKRHCRIISVNMPYRYRYKLLNLVPTLFHIVRKSGWRSLKILDIRPKQGDNRSLMQVYMAKTIANHPPRGLIICHFGVHGVLLTTLAKAGILQPDSNLITYFHGCDFSSYVRAKGKQVYTNLFAYGSKFVANSGFTRQKLIALGAAPSKVIKIPVGYDEKVFTYRDRPDAKLAPVIFISIGRLTEKKGHSYLIAAFQKVVASGLNAKLMIVGEGELKPELLRQIHHLELEDSVELLGRKTQQEVHELLQSAHVFVLASVTASNGDTEGQGLVLQESQAVGLPIIATKHNGFPDSIREHYTGFLVPERDVDALAQKMRLLGSNPDLRSKMGKAGAEFARKYFASEVIASVTEAAILGKSAQISQVYTTVSDRDTLISPA